MKSNVFRILTLGLGELLRARQQPQRSLPSRMVYQEHERERPRSDYEMYCWGFVPAPWY